MEVFSMKLLRCRYAGKVWTGFLQESVVRDLEGDIYVDPRPGRPIAPLEQVELLPPCLPSKILAVGLNYADHAAEAGKAPPPEPLLFLKPPSAVIGPEAPIVLPSLSRRVDYEAELALVVGRRCRNVRPEEASAYILGYTCANDVTARDLQRRDGQWTRSKGFDTFGPLGPWIVTDLDPSDVEVTARVNGVVRQRASTRSLIFAVPQLLAFASAVMTLQPGDVLLTGTPAGVGPLQAGDVVEVAVAGIGVLRNPVVGEGNRQGAEDAEGKGVG
jgi:2-keto-4-pentenoate hydratase/2-oxohepta-3-ene-1,7-dioic acid hydratase in catechol pathway